MQCVRRDLQTEADLAELMCLFQQQHRELALRQCQGAGQTADAATSDDDGRGLAHSP